MKERLNMSNKRLLSRRMLLMQSASFASAGLLGLTTAQADPQRRRRRSPARNNTRRRNNARRHTVRNLKLSDFQSAHGNTFRVFGAKYPVSLVLVGEKDLRRKNDKARPRNVRREPFSLLFKAPNFNKLKSGTYRFEHPRLGKHSLFLHMVRADDDSATVHYEVIFN